MAVARWSPIAMFTSSLIISWLWYESFIGLLAGGHAISGGVIITVICFCAGLFINIEFEFFFFNNQLKKNFEYIVRFSFFYANITKLTTI